MVSIRSAEKKDIEDIAKIHVATWQCVYRGQMPDDYLDSISVSERERMWERILTDSNSDVCVFVAEQNDKIIGFISGGKSRDGDADLGTAEIYTIYIDQNHLRKGVGTKLVKRLFEKFRDDEFTRVTLWVLDTNRMAKSFYEKNGWRKDGKLKIEKEDGFVLHEDRYFINLD